MTLEQVFKVEFQAHEGIKRRRAIEGDKNVDVTLIIVIAPRHRAKDGQRLKTILCLFPYRSRSGRWQTDQSHYRTLSVG